MKPHSRSKTVGFILLFAGSAAMAQAQVAGTPPPQPPPAGRVGRLPQGPGLRIRPAQPAPRRPPLERAMGRWWNDPGMVEKLSVTADQKKKMEDIFQQHRLKLIDLNASLQKAEAILEPLVSADQPDESKIVAQIDRVAQARAELEKANARMLLGIRQVLTPEQWKKLQDERPMPTPPPPPPPR